MVGATRTTSGRSRGLAHRAQWLLEVVRRSRDPALIELYADRIAWIDRAASKRWVLWLSRSGSGTF